MKKIDVLHSVFSFLDDSLKYSSFLEELHYTDYLRLSVKDHFVLLLDRHFGNLFTFFRSKKENTVRGRERGCWCVRLLTSFANATSSIFYMRVFNYDVA
jgi:hypothetical protein